MNRSKPVRKPRDYFSNDNLEVRRSAIHGRGVFTLANLPARKKVGDISGTLVKLPQARKAVESQPIIYFVELTDRLALDCSQGNHLKHINHSCEPNCYLRIIGKRVEVYALKPVKKGSELLADYGATPHKTGMTCGCGSRNCKRKL